MNMAKEAGARQAIKLAASGTKHEKYVRGGQSRGSLIGLAAGTGLGALAAKHRGLSGHALHRMSKRQIPLEMAKKLPWATKAAPLMMGGALLGSSIGEITGMIRGHKRYKQDKGARK